MVQRTCVCVCVYVFINRHPNLMLVRSWDPLCYHPGILLMSICRRDFCPFDRISYQLVSGAYYRLRIAVVDPSGKDRNKNRIKIETKETKREQKIAMGYRVSYSYFTSGNEHKFLDCFPEIE